MPKKKLRRSKNAIQELGQKLGFESKKEEQIHIHNGGGYSPTYDVVWYLKLDEHFKVHGIGRMFNNAPHLFERIKRLPFAVFEIEGSTTTS